MRLATTAVLAVRCVRNSGLEVFPRLHCLSSPGAGAPFAFHSWPRRSICYAVPAVTARWAGWALLEVRPPPPAETNALLFLRSLPSDKERTSLEFQVKPVYRVDAVIKRYGRFRSH